MIIHKQKARKKRVCKLNRTKSDDQVKEITTFLLKSLMGYGKPFNIEAKIVRKKHTRYVTATDIDRKAHVTVVFQAMHKTGVRLDYRHEQSEIDAMNALIGK